MLDTNYIKEILIPISTIITLISISVGSLIAVFAYRLNLKAETRLKESSKAETDVKLLGLMVSLIEKANGRNGYEVSHDAIKKILDSEEFSKINWLDLEKVKAINRVLEEIAIITFPVGTGEQDFAIRAIGELGLKHEFLSKISLTSLTELSRIPRLKELCENSIKEIKSNHA